MNANHHESGPGNPPLPPGFPLDFAGRFVPIRVIGGRRSIPAFMYFVVNGL
jgi:hypothetical protein